MPPRIDAPAGTENINRRLPRIDADESDVEDASPALQLLDSNHEEDGDIDIE